MATNQINGTITTGVSLTSALYDDPVIVTNTANISGTPNGIYAATAWTIDNAGTIGSSGTYGVYLYQGGSVTNEIGGVISGKMGGLFFRGADGATLDNAGTIESSGSYGAFLLAHNDGLVTNAMGGSISGGRDGIILSGTNAAVGNAGAITGTSGAGIYLAYGGSVVNAMHGTIGGGGNGVLIRDETGTVDNSGTITGGNNAEVTLAAGGSVTNETTGYISGSIDGVVAAGSTAMVENAGTITGGTDSVYLDASGTNRLIVDAGAVFDGKVVANATAANTIELTSGTMAGAIYGIGGSGHQYRNFQTVTIDHGATWTIGPVYSFVTVDNSGTLDGGAYRYVGKYTGVYLDAGGSVTNESGGSISGSTAGVYIRNAPGTVVNAGAISSMYGYDVYLGDGGSVTNKTGGTISGSFTGVKIVGIGTVENSGSISSDSYGVLLFSGGSVTNKTGGTIGGSDTGVGFITATGTVDNCGVISGTLRDGIYLKEGGSVTNETGGTISGGVAGVYVRYAAGTVDNFGTIIGPDDAGIKFADGGSITNEMGGSINGLDYGVHIAGAAGTVENFGTIIGTDSVGVDIEAGGSVTNEALGYITGVTFGILVHGSTATVENAGTIAGGTDFVYLNTSGTNRLIVDAGAVFDGKVVAKAGAANTIELTTGVSVGTIGGLGTHYTGFQTVTIDSGATWTVGGIEAGFNSATIQGFGVHDTLDVTNLMFNGGDSVTLNGSDLLTIEDGAGGTLETIQLAGSFTGDFFHLATDSGTGTLITENTTPCYCRGTRIRTPQGEVAVEALRIGDLVVTADGDVLPLKWIGRRSHRDWLAVGSEDVQPVCFRAGSIADGVPIRDLYVSPEHAMFLDGVLVPARHLVNDVSVVKVEGMEAVDYFHLEFDRHVVIYAEGAAAESFGDDDSRMLFHNADEYRGLYPDAQRDRFTEFCAPRVEGGRALDALRCSLAARAMRLQPDGTAAKALARLGYLDRATRTAVEGWAFAGIGEGPVRLAILVNGAVIGQTVADRYRAGLGFGDGHCSFRFDLPDRLSPDVSHRIEVRRASDWSPLIGGCVTLEPVAPYSA